MTYSQKRERSKYRNHKVRLCCLCVCVCEGFCITPTSSYAMLKHQLKLHNLLFVLKPDEMKENREIYTEEGMTYQSLTLRYRDSLCVCITMRIIITSHSSEHFATFSSPYCYILLPPQV